MYFSQLIYFPPNFCSCTFSQLVYFNTVSEERFEIRVGNVIDGGSVFGLFLGSRSWRWVVSETWRKCLRICCLVADKGFMERIRSRNMVSSSSSFHSTVYKEIEDIGWENLLSLSEDLRLLSVLIPDKRGKVYTLEILLDETHPKGQPSLSADVPHMFDVDWSRKSTIKDVVHQFLEHVNKLADLFATLDNIDQCLWVLDPKDASHSILHRQIKIEDSCSLILSINAEDPRSLPECRFIGSDPEVNTFRGMWRRNCKKWGKDKHVSENLAVVFETQLPGPPPSINHKNDQQVECGICYAQCLPFDDELGDKSGSETDYTCENGNCNRSFHTICLEDWLRSISSTRLSFDVLFGSCPYCSDPVAVKINSRQLNF